MRYAYSVEQIRRMEDAAIAEQGEDGLMQRAAAGLAAVARREVIERRGSVYGGRVVILVGPGKNGGDALFAGQRLARRGMHVVAIPCLGEPYADGLSALLQAGGQLSDFDSALGLLSRKPVPDLAIDGILGIGGRPGLPERVTDMLAALDAARVPVIAVDLPSGVSTDTGAVSGASVQALRTVTFGSLKPCHLLEPARSRCGSVDVIDIGLDLGSEQPALREWEVEDVAAAWPFPGATSDKYSRGVLGIDAGSDQYPGAGIMSTFGAVHAGAGMVRFLGATKPAEIIKGLLPNVVFAPGRVQAHLFGSGWGDRPDGDQVLTAAADKDVPALVDADGLGHLPKPAPANWLLTPHAGELARLLGCERTEVESDPAAAVSRAADETGATVLLKGSTQLVARPREAVIDVAVPGPSWTAQAGSGDVLGGICGMLLAAGLPADQAGIVGASVQALTAAAHPGPIPPHELAVRLPETIAKLQP